MNEPENQRKVMYQYMDVFPKLGVYLRVAKFEVKMHNKTSARKIFERTLEDLGEMALREEYFIEFGGFEV